MPPDQILAEWPEGVLPEHHELREEWWDYDSTAVSFSYTIPSTARDTAIEQLRRQIHRSAGRRSTPTESCFEVLEQTANYLLTSCKDSGDYQLPTAWEIRLTGDVITVVAGRPDDVLRDLNVSKSKNDAGR